MISWGVIPKSRAISRRASRPPACRRPHLVWLRSLPDGRWFDESVRTWRNRSGKPCRWPDLIEAAGLRSTRVVARRGAPGWQPGQQSAAQPPQPMPALPRAARRAASHPPAVADLPPALAAGLFLGPYAVDTMAQGATA
jgi:hypothetical protein